MISPFCLSQEEVVEKRHKEQAAKNAAKKKEKPVAKSMIILDIKPWDDETDMALLEKAVREIVADGLVWGSSKLVPVAFGVKKLQITTVIEDDKVCLLKLAST